MFKVDSIEISHAQLPQLPEADELTKRLLADPERGLQGVYRFYDRWHVRTFIRRQQFTLVKGDVHACIRFADAALLYFWYYRRRPAREPVDTDFNLGIQFARHDLENCEWLQRFLRAIEAELLSEKFMELSDKRCPSKDSDNFRRDVFLMDWERFRNSARGFILELKLSGGEAKITHDTFVENLDNLGRIIISADRQFVKPASITPRDPSADQIL